ncbi:MAG: Rpn family recombination-promoting nuclease/putative transposase [Lachnospiraceae bacterium]|nr:Rpn family recombination-promoting nuclease/putative transposase [Lachnospiraceae bacterium]
MGDIDISVKNFIKINSVFAQLFSQGVYNGMVRIDPDKLEELDTAAQEVVQSGDDGRLRGLERLRDVEKISKIFDGKAAFQVIMGVEGQTGVHYYMPVRCMELDAFSYSYQCRKISERAKEKKELRKYADGVPKGTKIVPVVTLVFYVGKEPWDGPMSVYDMLDIPDGMKAWMKYVAPNYRMNLIDVRHLKDEEIDRFEGDLKAFLLLLKDRFDREKMKSVVAMHKETWYAVSKIKNNKKYMEYIDSVSDEDLAGGVSMDAAWDYIEEIGKVKGEAKVNKLGLLLEEAGRTNDFMRSLSDMKLQKQLFVEFGIEQEN